MSSGLINISNLSHVITEGGQSRIILDHVNFSIEAGESIALLGRSGSGKSTLLNLISGIDQPNNGQIQIGTEEITALGEPGLTLFRRKHIGFIYQFFHLIPTLSVAENIALPMELNHWSAQETKERVEELLAQVGLSDLAARFPDQLSGGEQQRVAIARAIAHRPSVILADEPTGNLDAQIGQEVMALLNNLVEQEGATLILVTHSQAVAQSTNRILTLDQGNLTEQSGEFAW